MTVMEAIRQTQERGAGMMNGFSARYAQSLLAADEEVQAAVVANVAAKGERFPGVVVLTDRRVLAACGLPGIKRSVDCALDELDKIDEVATAINYKATFYAGKTAFCLTVDPEVGERFARHIAILNGEEDAFDAVDVGLDNGIFNPTLMRNKIRTRQLKAKERAKREAARAELESARRERAAADAAPEDESAGEVARRLARELDEAKARGQVADTDPRAVAARLAAELAAEETTRSE